MKNKPLNTSLRSDIQATDSTRSGWIAKTAATNALDQIRGGLILASKRKSNTAFALCNKTFTK